MKKSILTSILLLFSFLFSFAQGPGSAEMADTMRSNGKIYVVIAVIVTILAGLILYLIRIDRKVSKLEKENAS